MKFFKYIKTQNMSREKDPFVIKRGQVKDGKIGPVYRMGWAEDVYLAGSDTKETVGNTFDFSRLFTIKILLAVLLIVLIGKSAWLQIAQGAYYRAMAEGNRIRIERIEPKRGIIYDRNGQPLVRNAANFALYFVPADLPHAAGESGDNPELDRIVSEVNGILDDIDADGIKSRLASVKPRSPESYQPMFIEDNIAYKDAMKLYLKSLFWPGVTLSSKTRREYPIPSPSADLTENIAAAGREVASGEENVDAGLSLAHILGYTGKISQEELATAGDDYRPIDYIGKMGIEYFWENELKGQSGQKQVEVDALGKETKIIGQTEARDGHNLILSLDVTAQLKLEDIMLAYLSRFGFNRASAILMDPDSGEILAMVSLPAYNNNYFARGITQDEYDILQYDPDHPLFNRGISGEYPSGSTIKPVIAAAALEEGVITERTTINSVGGIRVGEWFFPDWLAGGHGLTNVKRALAESVNTFFYYVGGGYKDFKGLGVDRIVEYGKLFGLDAQTGVDLAGEASGLLPTPEWKEEKKGERWYIGDTYHLAIGQGDILVTPLQVAAYTAVFANGGALYRPHFVKQILSPDDRLISDIPTDPVRKDFIDGYNIEVVREGLRQAVTTGSARALQSVPVSVAGKTGTAQWTSDPDKPEHAWFTGFAPYDNPQVVITILVEEGGEGSDTAVPIARDFLAWYFGEYKK